METTPVQWCRNFFRGVRNVFREMALKDPLPAHESGGSFRETLLKGASERVWTTGSLRSGQRVRPVQFARLDPANFARFPARTRPSKGDEPPTIIRSQPLPYQPAQDPQTLPPGDEVTEIGGFLGEAAGTEARRVPGKASSMFRPAERPAVSFDYLA
jgi:hypothetical protein